jgi:hypothetical protein
MPNPLTFFTHLHVCSLWIAKLFCYFLEGHTWMLMQDLVDSLLKLDHTFFILTTCLVHFRNFWLDHNTFDEETWCGMRSRRWLTNLNIRWVDGTPLGFSISTRTGPRLASGVGGLNSSALPPLLYQHFFSLFCSRLASFQFFFFFSMFILYIVFIWKRNRRVWRLISRAWWWCRGVCCVHTISYYPRAQSYAHQESPRLSQLG